MSGLVTGIKAIQEAAKPRQKGVEWRFFKLESKEGKNTVRVRFLQEIDTDVDGFNPEIGPAIFAHYYSPNIKDGYRYRYYVDEENEHLLSSVPEWESKTQLFINVLAERDGEWKLEIWPCSKTTARLLIEYSNNDGGLTNRVYKVKRLGDGTATTYMFMGEAVDEERYEVTTEDVVDIKERLFTYLTEDAIKEHGGTPTVEDDEIAWPEG